MTPVIPSALVVLAIISAFTPLQITLAQGMATATNTPSELTCTAATAGNPCHGTPNNPGQDSSAANPVNLANGNKFQEELDFFGGPENSGLEFYRYYNSTQLTPALIGQGWRHSYSRKLYWRGDRPQILLDDSTRLMFEPLQGDVAKSRYDEYGTLHRVSLDAVMKRLNWTLTATSYAKRVGSEFFSTNYLATLKGDLWLWQYPSKAIDVFNSKGNLIISQMPASEAIFIEREIKPGPTFEAILNVKNQSYKSLNFHYAILGERARLHQIDTPIGSLEFKHDLPIGENEPRLLAAQHIDGSKITYEYTPVAKGFDEQLSPYLLQRAKHFSSNTKEPHRDVAWGYTSQGRANKVIFHRHENLNLPLVMQLDYVKIPQHQGDTGLTKLTQIVGEHKSHSRFHTTLMGNRYLLTKAEGAPCFKCPAPGTETKYNDAGYIIGFNGLDIKRNPLDNRIDSIGINHSGWPGLRIYYDKESNPYAWSSLYTGKTFYELDADTLYPKYKNYANKTRMFNHYNVNHKFWSTSYRKQPGSRYNSDLGSSLKKSGYVRHVLSNEIERKIINIKKFSQTIEYGTIRFWSNDVKSTLDDKFTPFYDNDLVEHRLPEWGKLYYQYDKNNQLKTIYWQPANAKKGDKWQMVYQRLNTTERKFGNQLLLKARKNTTIYKNSTKLELLREGENTPYWQEIRYHHKNGLLAAEHHLSSELAINRYRQYEYNPYGQIIRIDTEQRDNTQQSTISDLYAWHLGGASLGRQSTRKTIKDESIETHQDLVVKNIKRDAAGFIQSMNQFQLIHDERNLLIAIKKDEQTLASYAYDGLNHRVRKTTEEGETQYYYLNQQLVAEAFIPASRTDKNYGNTWQRKAYITRRYIYDGILPIAMIDYANDEHGQLYYIHSDGAGQPFMLTDQSQQVVWLADNEAFGQSKAIIEQIEFNLRLPGQYYDAESGLHQNLYRNYDPELGHYLEPDPLGPVGNNDTFGYAYQNPRQFVDPLGLLMFVFDGTTNTPESATNAYKLGQLYDEDAVYYLEGIGTQEAQDKAVDFFSAYQQKMQSTHKVSESSLLQRMHAFSLLEWEVPEFIPHIDSDKLFANMAPYLLNMQWMRLIDEMAKTTSKGLLLDQTFNIDLSGFSRGAALASIFANKIADYTHDSYFQYKAKWLPPGQQDIKACVNLRFVGLFDTVHQIGFFGNDNRHYNYTAAPAWGVYAHAVALNEHRKIMSLTRFKDNDTTNVDEYGFLGNHSDIGGSLFPVDLKAQTNPYPGTYGDLSNIPLAWIYSKAEAAQVPLKDLSALSQWQLDTVKNPLLHLASPWEQDTSDSSWLVMDRRVYSASGENLGLQARSKDLGHTVRSEHLESVDFKGQAIMLSPTSGHYGTYPYGVVRANDYLEFLKKAIGWSSSLKVISQ